MTNHPWKPNRHLATGFFFVSAASLLCTAVASTLLGAPSEAAVVFGLSTERLALLVGMLVLCGALIWLGYQTGWGKVLRPTWPGPGEGLSSGKKIITTVTALFFALGWLITWTPAERFGELYYYIGHIYAFVVWLTCASGAGLVLVMASYFGVDAGGWRSFVREQRAAFLVAGAALAVFGLICWLVSFRVVGMPWQDEDFWYGAGVPLLPIQVLFAVLTTLGVGILANKFPQTRKIEQKYWGEMLLFVMIWVIAGWLWATKPVNPDFFITKPVAPNFELYPDYDARFFDMVGQYALIGQGLNNHVFLDRPLYSALLVYLHIFAGQDYNLMMALQAALFAIFPALGYVLGRQLHSRKAGAGLAFLFTVWGLNAIEAGALINTAHPKQMLTDFPSAVLMVLLTILVVRWLQAPWKSWQSIGLAGGVIGLATLVRPHPLIYFVLLVPAIVWIYRRKARIAFSMSALLLVAALAGVLPWLESNGQGRTIVDFYLERVKDVIQQRYPDLKLPWSSEQPATRQVAATNLQNLQFAPASSQVFEKSVLAFSVDNFLNNLTTTVQTLPYTPYYQELQYTVKVSEDFWKPYWDGAMSPWAWVLLPINLLVLALGIGSAWKRAGVSGLVPLAILLGYFAMNALARTSGGRYIVPVNWVVIFYYFIGNLALVELAWAFFRTDFFHAGEATAALQTNNASQRSNWGRLAGVLGLFIVIGALIPLAGSIEATRYQPLSRKELVQQLTRKAGNQLAISGPQFSKFFSSPDAVIQQGRVLYPRQYEKDQGLEVSIYSFYRPLPYPRMIFTLLGPNGETRAIFPEQQAFALPNASDAIILGCRQSDNVQVWGVLTGDGKFFKRTPSSPLACPLPAPVCNNNHHCE